MAKIPGTLECYTDKELVDLFRQYPEKFTPEIANLIYKTYFILGSLDSIETIGKFVLFKKDDTYVGFRRYTIYPNNELNFDYVAVDSNHQKQGIGFSMCCYAIDEALSFNCKNIVASVSKAAQKLIINLRNKYPQLTFKTTNSFCE